VSTGLCHDEVQAMKVKRQASVRRYLWTAKKFYRLLDRNFFLNRRVELIEGVIYEMAAQKNYHAISIKLTDNVLSLAFGPTYWVRVQSSLDLTPYSVVDPDLAVIAGTPRDNATIDNPTSALLVVEVSETTLSQDRRVKGSLYAKAGIQDYWIVNLKRRVLEVRRNPGPDIKARFGASYQQCVILSPNDTISPLALPQAQIKVADLLP
jgi:Uma2 family endonuclease